MHCGNQVYYDFKKKDLEHNWSEYLCFEHRTRTEFDRLNPHQSLPMNV